ncbi:hypothetical protein EBR66_00445 [bacterium]|nr:hypothetical protein [bacterium]
MWKRKDNLTDLTERLPNVDVSAPPAPSVDQQVVNPYGEIVTLGNKKPENPAKEIKGIPLELMELVNATKRAVEKAFDRAIERLQKHE